MSLLAYVETYGCQMDVADTEIVLGLLQGAGYEDTYYPAAADVILINTCAVREKAVERVWGRAGTLATYKAKRPKVVLGITGCMAEHLRGQVRVRAPFVDLVVGPDGYRRLLAHIEEARAGAKIDDTTLDPSETYQGLDPARDATGTVVGHIAVQRGCDRFCAFCVVPYTRGRERGTAPDEVLRQARALVAAGGKEVQLLGQTVTSYRFGDVGLRGPLARVGRHRRHGAHSLRVTLSAGILRGGDRGHGRVSQDVQARAPAPAVGLRHGAGAHETGLQLRRVRELVAALRAALPAVAITTDVLVGFCGESEEEFAEILQALPSCASTTPSPLPIPNAPIPWPRGPWPTMFRPRSSSDAWPR